MEVSIALILTKFADRTASMKAPDIAAKRSVDCDGWGAGECGRQMGAGAGAAAWPAGADTVTTWTTSPSVMLQLYAVSGSLSTCDMNGFWNA